MSVRCKILAMTETLVEVETTINPEMMRARYEWYRVHSLILYNRGVENVLLAPNGVPTS